MKFRSTVLVLAAVFVLLGASDAFAWGPATHTELAQSILQQLGLLPAAIASVLARYTSSYIFGNVAADMVFAKRLSRIKLFCHHWSTGFKLLDSAPSERDRAFAFGYLSHLAADTVAHGKYVPRQLSVTRTTVNFGHLYWEMRADAMMPRPTWTALEQVLGEDHEQHHQVLSEELIHALLPYQYNRKLFDRLNGLMVRRYWQRCMTAWARRSRWDLSEQLVGDYRAESVARIQSVLTHLHDSPVLREDPSGTAALHQARLHRRDLRRLRRYGLPTEQRNAEAVAALSPNAMAFTAPVQV